MDSFSILYSQLQRHLWHVWYCRLLPGPSEPVLCWVHYIKHLSSEIIHSLYDFINAELRGILRLQGTQVMFCLPWEDLFSTIHHEERADACGGLFSHLIGKEYVV